jgi:hypothetical protein
MAFHLLVLLVPFSRWSLSIQFYLQGLIPVSMTWFSINEWTSIVSNSLMLFNKTNFGWIHSDQCFFLERIFTFLQQKHLGNFGKMCFFSVISTNFFNFRGKTRQNLDITNLKKNHWIWPLESWVQYTWHDLLALQKKFNKILVKKSLMNIK